jgi:hypothetical protein
LPVSSSLCDEVPHIFIPKSHLEPREFLISSAKRLLQQYLPLANIPNCLERPIRWRVYNLHRRFFATGTNKSSNRVG